MITNYWVSPKDADYAKQLLKENDNKLSADIIRKMKKFTMWPIQEVREYLDVIQQEIEIDFLKEENQKLRKVIDGLLLCRQEDEDARACPFYDTTATDNYNCTLTSLLDELGIKDY